MNGYNPESGLVLVPLDLNNEVIKPLERLEDKVDENTKALSEHLEAHEEEVRKRCAKRDRIKKVIIGVGSASVPLLMAVIARAIS